MGFLRRPSVTSVVCVATLVLTTGAASALFATVYGVLLRPLPYRDPARLIQINTVRERGAAAPGNVSLAEFEDWRAATQTLDEVAVFGSDEFVLAPPGQAAVSLRGAIVSERFFPLLGIAPSLGRWLDPAAPDRADVVISDRLWRSRFSADPQVTGRPVTLGGRSYAIAGVAPRSLAFPVADTDLWVPLGAARQSAPSSWNMRGYRQFSLIGRLRPGATLASAQDEAARIGRAWQAQYPRFSDGLRLSATPLHERITGNSRPPLLLLMAGVTLVLLIACMNLASLLIARNISRAREYGVRIALGASRSHMLRLALAEAGRLAAAGTAGGLALAVVLLRAMPALAAADLPRSGDVRVDTPVILAVAALMTLVTLGVGVAIGSSAWRDATSRALGDARTRADRRTRRVQTGLVAAQVALSLALVVTASLLLRSLSRLEDTSTGVANTGAITMRLSAVSRAFLDRALPQIRALPGARAAGVMSSLPPRGSQMHTTVSVAGGADGQALEASVDIVGVSPGAFEALGLDVLRGRAFTDADLLSDRRLIVLSENAAARLFPAGDAVGRALPFGPADPSRPPPEVIGVVANVRYAGLDLPPDGALYMPYTARGFAVTYLVVESEDRDPAALIGGVRQIVQDMDTGQAVSDARVLDDVIRASTVMPRVRTGLLTGLAAIALLLSAMGLYAVTAHIVGTRTTEIGIRMALGATRGRVRLQILREGAAIVAAGLIAGLVPAYAGVRIASRFLYGIGPADPGSIVASVAILLTAALAALWFPARRASRISPLAALGSGLVF